MIEKRICPYHKVDGQPEKTPSLAIYPNGFHCFSCGASGPLEQLGITKAIVQEKKVEDLSSALDYIESLPSVLWRGLEMPVDERYYYIVWPDRSFYLRRNRSDEGPKYLTPGGQKRPPYPLDRDWETGR